jgi:hypothetical protein
MAVRDAEGADQEVDRLSYDNAETAQAAVMTCRAHREFRVHYRHEREFPQSGFKPAGVVLVANSLQHLAEDEIPDQDRMPADDDAQKFDPVRQGSIEMIDPDRRIDHDTHSGGSSQCAPQVMLARASCDAGAGRLR